MPPASSLSRESARPPTLLALGWCAGAAAGALCGLAEGVLAPLGEPLRIAYTIGADGILGGLWGLLGGAAVVATTRRGGRRHAAAAGLILGWVTFAPAAAALGLLANRWLLAGMHYLSPASLLADAVAILAALGIAALCGKAAARAARRQPRLFSPRLRTVVASFVLLAAGIVLPPRFVEKGTPDPQRPWFVLVSIDTLRLDRVGAGGEPSATSPEIDCLCRQGVLFSEATAASPGSAASHAALFTSRYPISNGVWANFHVLDQSVETIAETMRARGYRTGAFLTNTFLGRRFQFDQGFDTFVESGLVERLEEPSAAALFRSLALVQICDRIRLRFNPGTDPSFETALAWLEESDRPTFLFVHFMDVHSPYVPPHPYGPLFGADPDGDPAEVTRRRNRYGWRPSVAAYLAEIRYADAKMGRLRKALMREGQFDECILALTSDHGENLVDHSPAFSHGKTIFDATLRILAAVRAPGRLPGGRIREGLFDNVDVLPTVFALLAWPLPAAWEGRDLCGPAAPARTFTFSSLDRDFAARSPDWKLVLRENGGKEYFDLRADPGETQAAAPPPDLATQVEQEFRAWFERTATELYLQDADKIEPEQLSPETIETLKTLGYIE